MEKPGSGRDEQHRQKEQKQAERRQKQRENNLLRAEKMHRLRLAGQAQNLTLPLGDLTATNPPLATQEGADQQLLDYQNRSRYHIGCSGWFYWEWKNVFYPESLPTSNWFSFYAEHFETVEINASFYSWPTIATVGNWLKQVDGKNFLYTVKVCELITHTRQFENTGALVDDFAYIAELLGPHMGRFLFQLPPSYQYTPARLQNIVAQLQNGHRNVVEFRHGSWWNEEVYAAFRKAGIIFCSCSAPGLPDELIRTADDIYIRFHGKKAWYKHLYTHEELQVWADRIKAANAQQAWIYFNNTFDAHAIENSQLLGRLLKAQAPGDIEITPRDSQATG